MARIQNDDQNNSNDKLYPDVEHKERDSFYLTWEQVSLELHKKKERTYLLNNVSGFAKSGECLAIMGGSGAGKSTLLNILANRMGSTKELKVNADVRLNKEELNWDHFRNIIGFVMQRDIFFENMRVNEIFRFTVELSNPNLPEKEKQEKIKSMIEELKIERAENSFVGGMFTKGISGGEKRRLNIGAELLTNPKILFLDEPTSGLDSYTAFLIITLLKKIAREKNIIVIYTIHQPTHDIFQLFDNLCILRKGETMYFGEAQKATGYFSELGYEPPSKRLPIDYFIDLSIKGNDEMIEQFNNSYKQTSLPFIQETIENVPNKKLDTHVKKAGFCREFNLLSRRAFKQVIRNPMTFKIRIAQTIFLTVLFCLMYGQIEKINPTDPNTILDRVGALFFLSVNQFMMYYSIATMLCRLNSSGGKRDFP